MTEFELMELLDVGMKETKSAIKLISEATSPPYQSVKLFFCYLMLFIIS